MQKSKERLLIIDSYSIGNRIYYGVRTAMSAPDGRDTKIIHGYLMMMIKNIQKYNIDKVVAAFDPRTKSFRSEISSEYKANRIKMDDTIHEQLNELKTILSMMNVEIAVKDGYEADDVIGTISKKEAKDKEVYILSGDRDLFALVSNDDSIRQIYPSSKLGDVLVDKEKVREILGVYPNQVNLFKALSGDSSDGITGVPGIGEKSAISIINELKAFTVDEVLDNIEENNNIKPRIKKLVIENKESAKISYDLAKICVDCGIDYSIQLYMDKVDIDGLYDYLLNLGLRQVTEKLSLSNTKNTNSDIEQNVSYKELVDIVDRQNMPYEVSLTLSDNLYVAFKNEPKLYILSERIDDALGYINEGAERILTYSLKSFLSRLPFDRRGDFFDIKLACYLVDATQQLTSIDLIKKYTDIELSEVLYAELKDKNGKKLKKTEIDKIKEEDNIKYGALLAAIATEKIEKIIIEEDLFKLMYEVEMPLSYLLNEMTESGISVDKNKLIEYEKDLRDKIDNLQKEIHGLAGEEFNIKSPKEVAHILYEKLGLKVLKKTKTSMSTAEEVLQKLIDEHPIVEKILEDRKLRKLYDNYIVNLIKYAEKDGKIHSTFRQTVTATGRLSSTDPNLQNLPIKSEIGRNLRHAFIARQGYIFVDADYSQIELRILAHMSKDKIMIEDFGNKSDIHLATASRIFKIPKSEVTPNQRRSAKAINFGLMYGMGNFSLSEDLNISQKEAKEYIENYFEHYSGVRKFLDNLVEFAKEKGYVETIFNRRRYLPNINSNNFIIRSQAERIAMNSPIQGSASDIMKIAMNNVDHKLKHDKLDAKIILQIHDEILIEAKEDIAEKVADILKTEMENAVKLLVDLEVEVSIGKSMYELK